MNDFHIRRVYDNLITDAEAKVIQQQHAEWIRIAAEQYDDIIGEVRHTWDEMRTTHAGIPVVRKRLTSVAAIVRTVTA